MPLHCVLHDVLDLCSASDIACHDAHCQVTVPCFHGPASSRAAKSTLHPTVMVSLSLVPERQICKCMAPLRKSLSRISMGS